MFDHLIYIAGYGRSGSTLLDVALGTIPGFFGAGELTWLFFDHHRNASCSCGNGLRECNYWRTVFDSRTVTSQCRATGPNAQLAWITRAVEHDRRQDLFSEYSSIWQAVLSAMSDVAGARVIVDSSKTTPPCIYRLSTLPRGLSATVSVIHLIRDPRSVMASVARGTNRALAQGATRGNPLVTVRAGIGYLRANIHARRALNETAAPLSITLRYEDLVANSEAAICALAQIIPAAVSDLQAVFAEGAALPPGHGIRGNRARSRSALHFRREPSAPLRLANSPLARLIGTVLYPYYARFPSLPPPCCLG